MDIAPEAVVSSLAKLVDVDLSELKNYVRSLPSKSSLTHKVPIPVRIFFHPSTLSQILKIREKLLEDTRSASEKRRANAIFVLACLLGILHGHSSFSLSIKSAHAYSMAPAYVSRFASRVALKPPKRNVKDCLIEKVSRCLTKPLPVVRKFDVRRATALCCTEVFPELIGKVDLILTSPPYLNAQTYAKDNWLRLWLLGYDYKAIKSQYIETGSVTRYGEYMEKVFSELKLLLRPRGRLICIAGDVRLRKQRKNSENNGYFATGKFLAELCSSARIGLSVEYYEEHHISSNHRYFHSLSKSNGHSKRGLIERIFIAAKP
jgi:site-specific DNA-methyltransferase (adenine-specific)